MRRIMSLVAAVAVLAAACSASDRSVAEVNGVEILQSAVTDLRESDNATVAGEEFRQDLMIVIAQEVINQAADSEYRIVVDQALVDSELQRLLSSLESSGQTVGDLLRVDGATEAMLRRNVEASLLRQDVISRLQVDPVRLEAIWHDLPDLFTIVCIRHLLVDSEEAAGAAKSRINAGEAFADVADEVSLDSLDGGDLGCSPSSRFVDAFAEAARVAPIGESYGPIETEFGWHVLDVYDRTEVALDDLLADSAQYVPEDIMTQEFVKWFNEKLRGAAVSVDPSVGEWFPDGPGILPPDQASETP